MTDSAQPKRFELARKTGRSTRIVTGLIGFVLTLAAGLLALNRPGRDLVSLSYDAPFVFHRAGSSAEIAIVYLDELKGDFLDRRPQASLLDALGEAGVKAIVYDLIFDRASEDPQVDLEFAAAMRRFRGVDENGDPIPGAPHRQIFLACGRQNYHSSGVSVEVLVTPTDVLLGAADNFGLAVYEDDEFVARRLTTGTIDEASLSWIAATSLGAPLSEESRSAPRWINFAGPPVDLRIAPDPDDPDGVPAFLSLKARDVLSDMNPDLLRGKIVVVGGEPGIVGEALGKDLFSTPFHRLRSGGRYPLMSGVEIQANMLENLRQGNWLTRADRDLDLLLVILTAALASIAFSLVRPVPAIVIAVVASLAFIALGTCSVAFLDTWFAWSVPAFLQLPVALGWVSGARYYLERSRRRRLGEAFAKVVSPEMLRRIATEGYELKLGGERTTAALMFTDLANFTTMSEDVGDPDKILRYLNKYFEATTKHVFTHRGAVIQYVGDAIYAAWGAPVPIDHAPREAAMAAWKLSANSRFTIPGEATEEHSLQTRIGLHYGEVVSGMAGSTKHMAYSLMGDSTNLAARLEGLNKIFGTNILCSEELQRELGDEFLTRRVGRFCVKGRDEATTIHELVGLRDDGPAPTWIADYHHALETLEANEPDQAAALFREIGTKRQPEGDGPSAFFVEHLATVKSIEDGIVHLNVK